MALSPIEGREQHHIWHRLKRSWAALGPLTAMLPNVGRGCCAGRLITVAVLFALCGHHAAPLLEAREKRSVAATARRDQALRDNERRIEASSSVPGPGALARRRGHYVWAPTIARGTHESERSHRAAAIKPSTTLKD